LQIPAIKVKEADPDEAGIVLDDYASTLTEEDFGLEH
jgi:hypothetical protein